MDILATHLQNNKASHGGISQKEYNEKFLLKAKFQTKKEPPSSDASQDYPIAQKLVTALSDTFDLVDESVEEGGSSSFQSSLPQFRTFIDSLAGHSGQCGEGKDKGTKKSGGGFPALEKLLSMDISTEEGILEGAAQFSTTI